MLMRPHRFAFNFGYGFDGSDENMTGASFLFASMFLELGLEFAIDSAATDLEYQHGIDVSKFWDMWRVNPGNLMGLHMSFSQLSLFSVFWSFSTLPSRFFCTSELDPCSCKGGVFGIFKTFCDRVEAEADAAEDTATNSTTTTTTTTTLAENQTLAFTKSAAKTEYVGLIESLEGSGTTILVTVVVIIIVVLIFVVARSFLANAAAKKELELANAAAAEEKEEFERRAEELRQANAKIHDQLMLSQLNAKQVALVEANSEDLDKQVPSVFQLNWRALMFESRLGSGSFGDCYKGRCVSSWGGG